METIDRAELEVLPTRALIADFLDSATELIRAETRLAKAEIVGEARQAAFASLFAGAGGVMLHAAMLCGILTLILWLSILLPPWVATAVLAMGLATLGTLLFADARRRAFAFTSRRAFTSRGARAGAGRG